MHMVHIVVVVIYIGEAYLERTEIFYHARQADVPADGHRVISDGTGESCGWICVHCKRHDTKYQSLNEQVEI